MISRNALARSTGTFAFLCLLFLAACSGLDNSATSNQDGPERSGLSANEIAKNLPADIEISIYQGQNFQPGEVVLLSDLLAEGRPVVLNFWAGLCPPCRLEMPDFEAASVELKDRAILVGVDIGPFIGLGSSEDGQALIQELGITYLTGTTFDAQVVSEYQVLGMPSTYFLLPDGNIHEKWTGLLTAEKLTELTEDLIAASAASP